RSNMFHRKSAEKCRMVALPCLQLGPIRYLQPQAWLGLPHAWGLPATPRDWDKVHGTEYQPNNIKRKHKHHWTGVGARIPARLFTPKKMVNNSLIPLSNKY
uniref:Uncharacterized protein n=1 Tax=Ailuropoda melanoleuca TaxID=9646 RepID=A0A7N5KCC5_AILME